MAGIRWAKAYHLVFGLSVAAVGAGSPALADPGAARLGAGENCSFRQDPDAFLSRQSRVVNDIFERTKRVGSIRTLSARTVAPAQMPRQNFIDDEIFGRLEKENVASAPLSTDVEFLRRVTLDLTGRVPSPQQVRDFVADNNPDKRSAVVTRLLWSPEFTDRWTMWMGDLLQNVGNQMSTANTAPTQSGRNAFFNWIKLAVDSDRSLRDVAFDLISNSTVNPPAQNVTALTATGTSWETDTGATNWILSAGTAGGPAQDSYDMALVRSATTFLGIGHYDCLLCHNGRGHLDAISLWAKGTTRQEAEQMASFFSRWRNTRQNVSPGGNANNLPYYVYDVTTGQYDLNTTSGNRPNRVPYGDKSEIKNLTPVYRDGTAAPANVSWRKTFADKLVNDPMFARNFANRLWKQMFTMGLVEPVDSLDPARLDPSKPPSGWDLQATHPELLEKLAQEFVRGNYSLRSFLQTLVNSNAYQLSSRYDGDWSLAYVPLFARHYPRRLEGEEIHDQLVSASQNFNKYTVYEWGDFTVQYAMQLPEPVEPRSNLGNALTFMNNFYRGNRDTTKRLQDGSILQQLALMNDSFVVNRIKIANSPKLKQISAMTDPGQIADEMFLTFLGRFPTTGEKAKVATLWSKATTATAKTDAIQDLAWACINKVEFLFSY